MAGATTTDSVQLLRQAFSGGPRARPARVRRGAANSQRPDRQASGGDRALPAHGRRRGRGRFRQGRRARDLRPRRRAQRRRQGSQRGRLDDRPLPDEGRSGRHRATDRARAAGTDDRGARPCHRGLRAGHPERHRLERRDRGSDPRRRPRLAAGQVRAGGRQPPLRRGGARVRRRGRRERRHRARPVLGAPGRRWELRRRQLVRVSRAPPRQRARRRGAVAARGGADGLLVLPRVLGRPARRPVSAGHPRPRARRIGSQGVRDRLLSRGRRRRAGRCRPAAAT